MKFIFFFIFILCLLWTLLLTYGLFKVRDVKNKKEEKASAFLILTIALSYVISYIIYN